MVIFKPPTLEKVGGHIAFGLSVCVSEHTNEYIGG